MNVKEWISSVIDMKEKLPMPILSFPSANLMGVTVKELTSNSDLQAKGMKLIADRHKTLASVSMMDLSVEAEAFGAKIHFAEDEVPTVVGALIQSPKDAEALIVPSVKAARCGIYLDAIKKARSLITDRPLLAGVIGPFSLAGRLMDVTEVMINCYTDPDMVHAVLDKCAEFLVNFIKEYRKNGADGVVIAEPLTGMLSPTLAEEFSQPYVRRIIEAVQDDEFCVVYHNCGDNVMLMADSFKKLGAMAYHYGNSIKLSEMITKMPSEVLVMGNVDPAGVIKNGSVESVRSATLGVMNECREYPNFIISSGCDIPHESSWKNIDAFFSAVSEFYANEK